ncbi:TonB-dependent receptor [Hymenobacter psychrotolerans]|uniref:Iron complex outermembrane recepter protein n=1 Tax=Hymenobacter psychrotolerans DSM 18569 TaxID=1121959 RepID=A0A1M6PBH5_9BACT|nr:TonB-dependent receptor [Hymenobacter psychrotolerans]SHK05293.1 iron complex outermembrane recepter protein [Hymenobacter psychrotolerans DSM 18569]
MLFRVPGAPAAAWRWLVVLFLLGAGLPTWAQPVCTLTVSGRVADHESRAALPGATIVVLETQQATQSDLDGHYHLQLCAGVYHVQVSFVGYAPETAELRLTSSAVRDFRLHPDAVLLRGAVVRGERMAAPTTQTTATLSGQELQQTRGQALGEALQRVSGVTAIQTGPGIFKPMIHGLHSNRVTILNNEVRQEGQQWGVEHGPEIDPFIASRLTVVKGAASVRYGSDAIGGVVLVEPKPLRDSAGIGGELNLVGMSNNGLGAVSGTLEGNLRKLPALSWRAQGTFRKAGTMRAPGYYLKNSGFAEHNAAASVGWRKDTYGIEVFYSQFNSRIGILPAAHAGNQSDLLLAVGRKRPLETTGFSYAIDRAYQQVRHDIGKLTGFVRTGNAGRLQLTLSQQLDFRDEYDKSRPRNDNRAAAGRPELSYTNRTTIGELLWEHKPWHQFTGSIGLTGTYQANRYADGSRQFIPFYTNQIAGAFVIEKWQQGRWLLEGGLRLDYRDLAVRRGDRDSTGVFFVERSRFRYATPAASLGATFDPTTHLTLSLTTGLTRRAPAANERFSDGVHNGMYELGNDLVPGNAPLTPETALNVGLTATWHNNPRFNGELTLYQNRIAGFIYQVPLLPLVQTIRGAHISWQYLQTDATFRGLDLSSSYQLAPQWLLGLKGSMVRTRDTRADEWQILMPADRAEATVRYDWPDTRTASRFHSRYVQLGGVAIARQTRVPNNYEARDLLLPPAGYGLLNLEMGSTLRWGSHPLQISVAGANLLSQRYRDYLNRYRYFTDEMGRNVTLRLRFTF